MIPWLVVGLSLGLVGYAYLGYPALVTLLAGLLGSPLRRDDSWTPTVSVCMAVRDEGGRVGAKLDMLLGQDYPADLVEILVGDDGSTDSTPEVLARYRAAHERIRVLRNDRPLGKASTLNRLVAAARGEVLLMVDCRQRVEPTALRALVARLADPRAGAVSGELILARPGDQGHGLGLYWRLEKRLRKAEADLDSVPGVTGALYVVRRDLFPKLPPGLILDDLAVPLAVVRAGKRVGFEPDARAYDEIRDERVEFTRKVRTLGGNLELPLRWPWVLSPLHHRIWFQYVSHKLLRLLVPYALVAAVVGFVVLPPPWRTLGIISTLLGLTLALAHHLSPGSMGRPGSLAHTFSTLNLAALLGPWAYLTGRLRWR